MKGIDLLAAACPDPATPDTAPQPMPTFTDEQLNKIADAVIAKLQQPAPDPAPADPDESPAPAPDPDPVDNGGDPSES